jgi:flagellar basal body-associated protein FliL
MPMFIFLMIIFVIAVLGVGVIAYVLVKGMAT